MVKRIVLTGGPCAGKTTVLSKIESFLLKKGYKVFIVRESATELIASGITPHEDGVGMLNFQKLILLYQYHKEEIYNKALEYINDDVVIIYDRALLDNRAYINNFQFDLILNELSLEIGKKIDEFDILSRYDMVIHLETSAVGKGYNLQNNVARYESQNDAILLDVETKNSWCMHDNFHVINSTDNFDDKVSSVINLIDDFISKDIDVKRRSRV